MNILISACLLGVNCKYSGGSNKADELLKHMGDAAFIPVCPEQLGGLSTPRLPAEIAENGDYIEILDNQGKNVTSQFMAGAEEVLKIAKLYDCKYAILKERSPSCGSSEVYDGSFQGRVRSGRGVTAALLEKNGIKVYSEENFDKLFENL